MRRRPRPPPLARRRRSSAVRVRSAARKRSAYASDFLPSPTCSPRVDVEQPDRLQQLARALAQRRLDVAPPGTSPSTTSATSCVAGGKVEIAGACSASAAGRATRASRSSSTAQVRAGRPSAVDDPRVQLAGVADDRSAVDGDDSSAQRPGCHGAVLRRRDAELDAGLGRQRCGRPRRRRPSRPARPVPHQPAGSRAPASDAGDVARLVGQRRVERGELARRSAGASTRGAAATARPRRRRGRPARSRRAPGRGSPRPTLRRSAASRPGSSVVRSRGSSSESGLASRSTSRRRRRRPASPSASRTASPTNG